jgi:hypothetical protein
MCLLSMVARKLALEKFVYHRLVEIVVRRLGQTLATMALVKSPMKGSEHCIATVGIRTEYYALPLSPLAQGEV